MASIYTQVKLATSENINLSSTWALGVDTLDGVLVVDGDRVLVKSQTDRKQNGIYYFNPQGVLTRATDFALGSTQSGGTIVFIQQGYIHDNSGWVITSNGNLVVGTDDIEFGKFSVNLKVSGADLPSSIILRQEKGYPLTNDELDGNFKYLAVSLTEKLNIVDFNPITIRDRINSLSAAQASLNAWHLRDQAPTAEAVGDTVMIRNADGDTRANFFIGDLNGNADTADLADYATLANNVDGIVAIANGGTGASTEAGARLNLDVLHRAGDSMNGTLTLVAADINVASLNIPTQVNTVSTPDTGDIWSDGEFIVYHLNGVTEKVARLHSPNFTGAPTAPTAEIASDSTAIATTAYVQKHRKEINDEVALKATIDSPSLTGTPKSITPATDTDSTGVLKTMIATVEYVAKKIAKVLEDYSTTAQVATAITTALTTYYTKTESDSNLTTALSSYYTKTDIDTAFTSYNTASQVDTKITNAVSGKANKSYVDDLQDKWGSSKKFVQSTQPSNSESSDGDFWFKV